MASTYTTNIGIEKPATGDQSGTWGETTNTNFDIIDQGTNGVAVVTLASAGTSGSPNSLPISNGALSDGRNRFIEFNDGGDLGATAYVQLDPNDAEKIVHIRNSLSGSRSLILFQGTYNASNDFEVPNGADVLVKFDGGGTGATVTDVNVNLTPTKVTTGDLDVDNININGNTISSIDTNGDITLDPNGTGDIVLDANVGIGTTSPDKNLHIEAEPPVFRMTNPQSSSSLDLSMGKIEWETRDASAPGVIGYIDVVDSNNFGTTFDMAFATGQSGSATERMRITSAGNVGIGTASPSRQLEIYDDGTNGQAVLAITAQNTENSRIMFADPDDSNIGILDYNHSDDSMRFIVNNSERMRITSAGNVGIGNSASGFNAGANNLVVGTGSGSEGITIYADNSSNSAVFFADPDSVTTGQINYQHASNAFTFHTNGGSERMRLDSSGNVGIGSVSPTAGFRASINGDGSSIIGGVEFRNNPSGGSTFTIGHASPTSPSGTLNVVDAANLTFNTHNTERMRLDSSGNLLHGKTVQAIGTVGVTLVNGQITATADGADAIRLNRKSSDGSIIDLRKDGTTVGVIGVVDGDIPYFTASEGTSGLKFDGDNSRISPCNATGAVLDSTTDLGTSGGRFKNIYLSGDIQLGNGYNLSWGGSYGSGYPTVYATTGSGGYITFAPNGNTPSTNQVRIVGEGIEFGAASSNLDDYEEGTWTVAFNASVTNPTVTAQGNSFGRYVKIGNIVHFWFYDSGTTITDAGSGFASVGGLPYTNETGYYPVFQYLHGNQFATTTSGGYVSAGTSTCIFIQTDTISTVLWATGTKYMMISGTYRTA